MTEGIGDSTQDDALPILQRRRIEAGIVAPIYRILRRDLGTERAQEIIREAVTADSREQGRRMAASEPGGANLSTFIAIQDLWKAGGALETETLVATPEQYDYDVTRCQYAEMYKDLGLAEIGHLLSCERDYQFPLGYDEDITLTRTTTIMEGAPRCDFRYRRPPSGTAPTGTAPTGTAPADSTPDKGGQE